MKSLFILTIATTLLSVPLCSKLPSTKLSLEQTIEQQLSKEQHHLQSSNELLSSQNAYKSLNRKRRYLEFPEGSSFQLVYDLIVGVVDFTNYLVLGVTVALAWELPSKPPSEIFNDISERLKDGTLGTSRNDTVSNIEYANLKNKATATKSLVNLYQYNLQPMFRPPMHYQHYTDGLYEHPNNKKLHDLKFYTPYQYKSWSLENNRFNTPKVTHPFVKWTQAKNLPKSSVKDTKYPWWNLPERLKNSLNKRPSVRRFDKNIIYSRIHSNYKKPMGTRSNFRGTGRSEHRIYPVFGKRSISAQEEQNENLTLNHLRYRRSGIATERLSKLDLIHIEHHRRTRHEMYQRIETYLNGRGSHGHHCVLRALCETGQKSTEHKPGSFVGELMRAIFTMPEPLNTAAKGHQPIGDKMQRYDAANALKEDCAIRYNHCKDSLWTSHFVL